MIAELISTVIDHIYGTYNYACTKPYIPQMYTLIFNLNRICTKTNLLFPIGIHVLLCPENPQVAKWQLNIR